MKIKSLLLFLVVSLSFLAVSRDNTPLPAVGGYDLVSYQTENKAVRGSGFHVTKYKKKSYLFSSEENKKTFLANPKKYLPAFNGWCAFGVAVKKKFHTDPTVFEVVDGTLYLNLDKKIQEKWASEKSKNISTAHVNWKKIKRKAAHKL